MLNNRISIKRIGHKDKCSYRQKIQTKDGISSKTMRRAKKIALIEAQINHSI